MWSGGHLTPVLTSHTGLEAAAISFLLKAEAVKNETAALVSALSPSQRFYDNGGPGSRRFSAASLYVTNGPEVICFLTQKRSECRLGMYEGVSTVGPASGQNWDGGDVSRHAEYLKAGDVHLSTGGQTNRELCA